jgi:hypothetical protein
MFLPDKTIKIQKLNQTVKINAMYFNIPQETKMVNGFLTMLIWLQTGLHLGGKNT